MAKKLTGKIVAKKIRFIRKNKERPKYWRHFRRSVGIFWPLSILLIGAICCVIISLFYVSVHAPEWTLHELGIQDRVDLSSPSLSNQGNIVLKAERESAFEKLGPVGDFFGGIINPVLTFISVCLLLLSIKTQREELKETRKEMQAATLQAERTATAAKESIKVTKINERPLLELYKSENFECAHLLLSGLTILKDNQYTHRNVELTLHIRNSGKSLAFLKKVEIRINDREGGLMKIDIETSIPRSSGSANPVKMKTILPIDESYAKNGVFKYSSYKSGKIVIFYEDSFSIKYSSEYSIKIDNTYDRSINIIVDENSIIDSFDLH